MHHPAIGLCYLFALSCRTRQATAEIKSRSLYDSNSFAVQLCRESVSPSIRRWEYSYIMGMQVEQENSLIGTRILVVLVIVVGVAGYFLIRAWLLGHRRMT